MKKEKPEWISPEDNEALRGLWSQYMCQKKLEQEMAQSILLTKDIKRNTAEHDRVWSPTMRRKRSFPYIPQSIPRTADADRIVEQFRTQNKALMMAVDDLIPNKKSFDEAFDATVKRITDLLHRGVGVDLYDGDRLVSRIRPIFSALQMAQAIAGHNSEGDFYDVCEELHGRRVAAMKACTPCPNCGTEQVQLMTFNDHTAYQQCRHCRDRWSTNIKK